MELISQKSIIFIKYLLFELAKVEKKMKLKGKKKKKRLFFLFKCQTVYSKINFAK